MPHALSPAPGRRAIPVALLAVALMLLLVPGARADDGETSRIIVVQGEGVVQAPPDQARLSAGVTHQAASAREAMAGANRRMAQLLAALRQFGIAERDLRTGALRLQPVYPRQGQGRQTPAAPEAFRGDNRVTVRLRELDRTGELLDLLLEAGANRIDGLTFSIAEPQPLLDEARRKAMADARRRATLYAAEAGVALGAVVSVQEAGVAVPRPMMRAATFAAADSGEAIARGENEVRATVTVGYAIR